MHPYVVDAFAEQPLSGNPVAVFFGSDDLNAQQMQRIAREINLSETTFVPRPRRPGSDARVRIFTPICELPFAGHPLLGTVVAPGLRTEGDRLRIETATGVILFSPERAPECADEVAIWASVRRPVPVGQPFDRTGELLQAPGVSTSTLPVEMHVSGPRHVLVGLESTEALAKVNPDHRALSRFPDLAVDCFAGGGTVWRNRTFSPAHGVVEDAATGSAAGPLAIHLGRHGLSTCGRRIEIAQGVEIGRPSPMGALVHGQGDRVDSVEVLGHGVLTVEGRLHVCPVPVDQDLRRGGRPSYRQPLRVAHGHRGSAPPRVPRAACRTDGAAGAVAGARRRPRPTGAPRAGLGHGRPPGPYTVPHRGAGRGDGSRDRLRHPRRQPKVPGTGREPVGVRRPAPEGVHPADHVRRPRAPAVRRGRRSPVVRMACLHACHEHGLLPEPAAGWP
ncbi:PhzF family phenazine biosynthesis isomerase [Streptomyces hyaluromycini]|uniref:PhzF family phenazine biosynthesis protein n=1 Tax=Streptomyces hyaluromycini TaxID=1377993 RepID=UPI000B5C1F46